MTGEPTRTVHCLVSGRVQGVWFRQSTAEQAREHGLRGWVRNREDGRVEARLQGRPEDVEAVLRWMRDGGPPAAEVSAVDCRDRPDEEALPSPFEVQR